MSEKRKFYVVWEGHAPGIYDTWEECQRQVNGYPGARYKAFTDQDAATAAFRGSPQEHMGLINNLKAHAPRPKGDVTDFPEIRLDAVAVDGACAGNPGPMEYRAVRVIDGVEIFHGGPYSGGTNNIGEYLAIIHMAALLAQRGDTKTPIYTDSRTAMAWIRARHSKSTIQPNAQNAAVRNLLARADAWLANHTIPNPLLKWESERWGEIPADFGRK